MQVLLMTMVLAGITTMLLRVTLSRTSSARQTRRAALSEVLIQACMAEVNGVWSAKTPAAFRRDLNGDESGDNKGKPIMYCANPKDGACAAGDRVRSYTCEYDYNGTPYTVTAEFEKVKDVWRLVYTVNQSTTNLL